MGPTSRWGCLGWTAPSSARAKARPCGGLVDCTRQTVSWPGGKAMAFGDAYVGGSKQRDPVDVLTDDVMSGVDELIRLGLADPDRLFLYSSSNGASAINQLLTQTKAFRAAVSHGGVADWLGYYQE